MMLAQVLAQGRPGRVVGKGQKRNAAQHSTAYHVQARTRTRTGTGMGMGTRMRRAPDADGRGWVWGGEVRRRPPCAPANADGPEVEDKNVLNSMRPASALPLPLLLLLDE